MLCGCVLYGCVIDILVLFNKAILLHHSIFKKLSFFDVVLQIEKKRERVSILTMDESQDVHLARLMAKYRRMVSYFYFFNIKKKTKKNNLLCIRYY